MAFSDDWREWLAITGFRVWRRIRPVVRSASSVRMSNLYSISGFAFGVIAIPIALIAWPAVIVAGVGLFAGFGYALDGRIKRLSMRVAAGHDSKIQARDFYDAPLTPDEGYRLARPASVSRAELYPYTDLSDHSLFIAAENDLTRDQRASLYQRWYTLCPAAFMHLEVRDGARNGARDGARDGEEWRPIAVSIILPLSAAGYRDITINDKARRRTVVQLDQDGILKNPSGKHAFLLIDTWIVDREGGYGGTGHGKSDSRGGNANLLVLRHLAEFWNTGNRYRRMKFLVETANPHLVPALEAMSFRRSGTSGIGEAFYATTSEEMDALAPTEFARLKSALRQIESVPVHVGTAPAPAGWYYGV
jgi:hypothetical protein